MIVVKLIGGLGNQMFQYAAGRYLAYMHKTDLYLDTSFLEKKSEGAYTQRKYELSKFLIEAKFAGPDERKIFKAGNQIRRTLQRKLPLVFNNLYVAESGTSYHNEFLSYPRNTYLDGFWQSERYFKPIEELLRNEFSVQTKLNEKNQHFLDKIKQTNSVAIHVRRGDYVHHPNANVHHGICSLLYYEQAIAHLKKTENDMSLFVFSDDLEWCKNNFKFDLPINFVDSNDASNAHFDMHLMKHCKNAIIANSSFSWWAAWLNANPKKIIVAPIKWFNDASIDTSDLIPETWIKI